MGPAPASSPLQHLKSGLLDLVRLYCTWVPVHPCPALLVQQPWLLVQQTPLPPVSDFPVPTSFLPDSLGRDRHLTKSGYLQSVLHPQTQQRQGKHVARQMDHGRLCTIHDIPRLHHMEVNACFMALLPKPCVCHRKAI